MKKILLILLSFCFTSLYAQENTTATRVFVDCMFCDYDFIRTEIKFVEYVTERTVADVHVLITTQPNGGGGDAYTLDFIGQGRFQGQKFPVKFNTAATETTDERRNKLVHHLKIGLLPFVSEATMPNLTIGYNPPANTTQTAAKDHWNLWSFRVGGNLNISEDANYSDKNYSARFNGTRTSERWKTSFGLQTRVNRSVFRYTDDDGDEVKSETENTYRAIRADAVYALAKKTSVQAEASLYASSYENIAQAIRIRGGVEYSFTPYSASTRRQLKVQWRPNFQKVAYQDTTIYLKTKENLLQNVVSFIVYQQQPWGSASISLEGSHFMHDFSKNNVSLSGNIDWRIFKGLSMQWGGSLSLIHDQLGISKGGLTEAELFTRVHELETNYRYWTWLSLAYRFGSTKNNVVNSRFDNGGGFFFFSD